MCVKNGACRARGAGVEDQASLVSELQKGPWSARMNSSSAMKGELSARGLPRLQESDNDLLMPGREARQSSHIKNVGEMH